MTIELANDVEMPNTRISGPPNETHDFKRGAKAGSLHPIVGPLSRDAEKESSKITK